MEASFPSPQVSAEPTHEKQQAMLISSYKRAVALLHK